jgi:HEPN domain-containing protein
MPLSFEMFKTLEDYSGLEKLHVYGDFLTLYSLPVNGTISETGKIFNNLEILDKRIFCLYASYVLAKAGFYLTDLRNPEVDDGTENPDNFFFTTDFNDKDWLELADFIFYYDESYEGKDVWSFEFANKKNETIKIFFVDFLYEDYKAPIEFTQGTSYFLLHPRLSRKARETCTRFADRIKEETGVDLAFSTGQFVAKYIPDKEKRQVVEANWEFLRQQVLGEFQSKWKILTYSIYRKEIDESYNELQKARLKLETGINLEEAVFCAGIACEGLLKALYSTKPKRIHDRMTFDEYLNDLTDLISEDFGEDILSDLRLIQEWRNKVAHAPREIPDKITALKIVTKAELFQKLFDDNLKRQSPTN